MKKSWKEGGFEIIKKAGGRLDLLTDDEGWRQGTWRTAPTKLADRWTTDRSGGVYKRTVYHLYSLSLSTLDSWYVCLADVLYSFVLFDLRCAFSSRSFFGDARSNPKRLKRRRITAISTADGLVVVVMVTAVLLLLSVVRRLPVIFGTRSPSLLFLSA